MIDQPADAADPPPAVQGGDDEQPPSAARRRLRAAVALTLVAAIVVFGALGGSGLLRPSGGDPPAVPPRPARLAAIDANGALAALDGSGASIASYAAPGVRFEFPVWSPDGAQIAAVGRTATGSGIYVFPAQPGATAGEPRVVYDGSKEPPFYLYWTPDSRRLAFLTTEADGIALRIAPADGSAKDLVVRKGAPLYWDWLEPGRLIAHVGGNGPDAHLDELGLDGAAADVAVVAPGAAGGLGVFRAPVVSRDGRYRAYVGTGGATPEHLVVETRDRSSSHELAVAGMTALGFDPTGGSGLAFLGPDPSAGQAPEIPIGPLRLIDAASGTSRTLLGGSVVAFFWAPDGRTIATISVAGPGNGGVEAANDVFVPVVARSRPAEREPAVAADELPGFVVHLGFVDVASGTIRGEQDVRVSILFANQVLPFFDQYALSHRFWSADSAAIALPLVGADGKDQLAVLPADGSAVRPIADRVIGFWSP